MPPTSADVDLQLKKRARRRLLGAVAFAGLAAVVLPMVMDEEPKQQIQEVQIRIPGQDQTPFAPKLAKAPAASETPQPPVKAETPPPAPVSRATEKAPEKKEEKPLQEKVEKAEKAEKAPAPTAPAPKPVEKPVEKPAEKAADKTSADHSEAQRAAAILAGKTVEPREQASAPASGNGQFVILIGAFANPANVKQLQTKIGELGIKVFTEPLESPAGTKTRVRAGPFPSREAADKALGKLNRIGVNGVVAAK